jgi:CRISPR-associated protein Cmr4
MYSATKILYIYTISPLHVGAGSSLSAVDLPIQRERITGFPNIHAGSLKGALRDAAREKGMLKEHLNAIFGPERPDYSGAVGVGDAQILLFPVRSIKGVFAWTTCLGVLQRWARTVGNAHPMPQIPLSDPVPGEVPGCYALGGVVDSSQFVILEDVLLKKVDIPEAEGGNKVLQDLANWIADHCLAMTEYWKRTLKNKLVILRDDDFTYLTQNATEVQTRIRINPDTKTVESGALWTEEELPVDTLLYAPIHARRFMIPENKQPDNLQELVDSDPAKEAENILTKVNKCIGETLQIGGDETVGAGFTKLAWI